jgi:hypothetical protein
VNQQGETIMKSLPWRSTTVAVLAFAVVNLGVASTAQAGIVDTQAMVRTDRDVHLAVIQAQLNRADVRVELAQLGVDETAIDQRVANLSDSELASLSKQMQDAPAGGEILVLVGAVFVVLLILEWVGVIDIFKKTPSR